MRTRRIVELLAEVITQHAPELGDRAQELAAAAFKEVGIETKAPKKDAILESGYLVFLSRHQLQALAQAAIDAAAAEDVAQHLKKANAKGLVDKENSIDIALFGRMVAEQGDLNVDAAVQVAHAISVHPVETEFDYFTAVDDYLGEDETGAGMIGTVEFNSSTLYRYATLDVNRLVDNLGDLAATQRATEAFIEAFVRSMPTGKQNTFANRTLPEAVVVLIRDSQSINLVRAFEQPVRESERTGRIKQASEALLTEALEIQRAYNETPCAGWVVRIGDDTASLEGLGHNVSLDQLVTEVGAMVAERLQDRP